MASSIESNRVTELYTLQCHSEENTLPNVTQYCVTVQVMKWSCSIGQIVLTNSWIDSIV